jgi:hypothetical protein
VLILGLKKRRGGRREGEEGGEERRRGERREGRRGEKERRKERKRGDDEYHLEVDSYQISSIVYLLYDIDK